MSTQNSELSKGLIFRAPLSEWYPSTDLVSGLVGVKTDVYNVADRQGNGCRREVLYNGTSSYTTLADADRYSFTNYFSILINCRPTSLTGSPALVSKMNGETAKEYDTYLTEDGRVQVVLTNGAGYTGWSYYYTPVCISVNTDYRIAIILSGTTITVTVNGVSYSTTKTDVAGGFTSLINQSGDVLIGKEVSSQYFSGSISLVRIFNYALTPTQIANYSKPEYPIEAIHRGAGATKNVLDLNASGLSASTPTYWYDRTNSTAPSYTSVAATNTNCSLVVPPASNLAATNFNGSTSLIDSNVILPLTGDITISFWINPQLVVNNKILSTEDLTILLYSNNNIICIRNESSTATAVSSANSSILQNTSYNIIFTSTSAGIGNIYVNGVLSGTANQSGGTPLASSTSLLIGTSYYNPNYKYNGVLNNCNIWNHILDSSQITLVKETNF